MAYENIVVYGETNDGEIVRVDIDELLAHLEPEEREDFINSLFEDSENEGEETE